MSGEGLDQLREDADVLLTSELQLGSETFLHGCHHGCHNQQIEAITIYTSSQNKVAIIFWSGTLDLFIVANILVRILAQKDSGKL